MTNDRGPSDPTDRPDQSGPAERFAERWSRLEPDEQTLVAMAITEMYAGTFTSRASWERFVDAALELLPALATGALSATELHEIAMRHAFGDHED
jgi:hypothetical protein